MIQDAIAGCCGVDIEYGRAITVHMPMPLRLSVLRSVAEIRIDDIAVLDELDDHIEQIEDCIRRRNGLAHRVWCQHPETGALFTVKEEARTRLEVELLPMDVDQVEADADFIYQVGIQFFVFQGRHGLRPTLPAKHRPRAHKSKAARKKLRNKK